MQELKKYLESSKEAMNETIVQVQKEIDELYNQYLDNPFNEDIKIRMQSKGNAKFHQYGWLGAIESTLEKIKELEEQDKQEFELALDEIPVTERELKADCPF